MNHDEAIVTLLVAMTDQQVQHAPSGKEYLRAQDHVARCSDCWELLSRLYEISTGERPMDFDHMGKLYGCDQIQGQFHLVEDLSAADIKANHPEVVRHLAWCHACRERLLEVLRIDHAATRGEYGPPLSVLSIPRSQSVKASPPVRISDVLGKIIVRISKGALVVDVASPAVLGSSIPAQATRAAVHGEEGTTSGYRLYCPLGASDLSAELTLRSIGGKRVSLEVQVTGADRRLLSIRLSAGQQERGRATTKGEEPVMLRDIPEGEYIIEIMDLENTRCFRVALHVEVAESVHANP